jgi:SNF2 family DNA or RNA helicase
MDAKDHLDMPELIYNNIPVRLPKEGLRVYKEMEDNFITILNSGEAVTSINAGVAGMRCRQIANGGLYLEDGSVEHIHTAKMDALKEIVDEMQGKPLLVFYEFKHDQDRIVKALGDVPNLTTSKNPDKLVEEFNAGLHPVMIGHPATIGMGLNLQGSCSHICWAGIPWDLGLYDQANARVYRQGQEADRVVVHHLVAEGTIDEKVLKALAVKGRQQKDLLDAIQAIRKRNQ